MEPLERRVAVLSTLLWTHVGILAGVSVLLASEGGIVLPMVLEQVGYFIGMGLADGQSGPDGYALFFHFLALFTASLALYAFQRGETWLPPAAYGALVAGIFAAPLGILVPAFLVWVMRRPGFGDVWHDAPSLQPKAARSIAFVWIAATILLGVLAAFAFFGFVSGNGGFGLLVFFAAPLPQFGALLWLQRQPAKTRKKERQEETGPMPRLPEIAHEQGP